MPRGRPTKKETASRSQPKRARSPSPPSSNEEEGIYTVERIVQKRTDRNVGERESINCMVMTLFLFFFS